MLVRVAFIALCVLAGHSSALNSRNHVVGDLASPDVSSNVLRNTYVISLDLMSVNNVSSSDVISVRYFGDSNASDRHASTVVGGTSGPYTFKFTTSPETLGSFHSVSEVQQNQHIGFNVYQNSLRLAQFNLSQQIQQSFPNTSEMSNLALWSDYVLIQTVKAANGVSATYQVTYHADVDVDGLIDIHVPLWKLIMYAALVKLALSMAIAFFDWCFNPLFGASKLTKLGVWFGNTLWLLLGGMETGLLYILSGSLLMLTLVFIPFGIKLVRIGVFAMFPFGREIRKDEESAEKEFCSFVGNFFWLVFLGIPIVLLHLVDGLILVCLIVTIPFGLQHFKLARIAFMPFGHTVTYQRYNAVGEGDPEKVPLKGTQAAGAIQPVTYNA